MTRDFIMERIKDFIRDNNRSPVKVRLDSDLMNEVLELSRDQTGAEIDIVANRLSKPVMGMVWEVDDNVHELLFS